MYQPHTLVTFGGTLTEQTSDDEIWQCGIRGFQQGGGQVAQNQLAALALGILRGPTGSGGGLEGIWGEGKSGISLTTKLVWCKAVNINPDGTYADEAQTAEMTPVAGSVGNTAPSFCTAAISLTTGKHLGLARIGRVYIPNFGLPLGPGSTIAAGAMAGLGEWAQEMMHAIDHSDTTNNNYDFNPYIVSKSGVSNPITGIRIGNVWDTQRRRKDAVHEVYQDFPLTGPSGA